MSSIETRHDSGRKTQSWRVDDPKRKSRARSPSLLINEYLEENESHFREAAELLVTTRISRGDARHSSQHRRGGQTDGSIARQSQPSERTSQQHLLPARFSTISADGTGSAEEQAKVMLRRAMAGSTLRTTQPQTHSNTHRPAGESTRTRDTDPFLALRARPTTQMAAPVREREAPSRRRTGRPILQESSAGPMAYPPSLEALEDPMPIHPRAPKAKTPRGLHTDGMEFASGSPLNDATGYPRRNGRRERDEPRNSFPAPSKIYYGINSSLAPDPQHWEHEKHLEILAGKRWDRLSNFSEADRDYVTTRTMERVRRIFERDRQTRWQSHKSRLQDIPMFTLYQRYNGNPPVQPEAVRLLEARLAQAQNDLLQGWEDDWQECCTQWYDILDLVAAKLEAEHSD